MYNFDYLQCCASLTNAGEAPRIINADNGKIGDVTIMKKNNLTRWLRLVLVPAGAISSLLSMAAVANPIPALPDSALNQCIEELASNHGWTQLEQVDEIACSSRGVRNLAGLELFTSLKILDVSHNPLAAVESLYFLGAPKLQSLNVSYSSVVVTDQLSHILNHQSDLMALSVANVLSDVTALPQFPSQLLAIDLADNNLVDLDWLTQMPLLQKINVSHNPIHTLDPLLQFPHLRELAIAATELAYWSETWQWPQLEMLDASNMRLTDFWAFRQSLSQMPQLQHLALVNLPVTESWLADIANPSLMRVLNVSGAEPSVVNGVGHFTQLRELYLRNIELHSAMQLGVLFDHLEVLDLAENRLTDFDPFQVWSFLAQNIRVLDLSFNQLQSLVLPDNFASQLKQLRINGNHQLPPQSVAQILLRLHAVEQLGLADVLMGADVLHSLSNKSNITQLNVSGNRIQGVLDLSEYSGLREFYAANNEIEFLHGIENLPNLAVLDLADNRFNEFLLWPGAHSLVELNLANNQLNYIDLPPDITALKILNLSNNEKLEEWQVQKIVQQNDSLQEIYLDGLPFQWHWIDQPHFFQQLTALSLANTGLQYIDYNVSQFSRLRYLDVSDNQLLDVFAVMHLPTLRHLNIANNLIVGGLMGSQIYSLEYFDVSNNPFNDIYSLEAFLSQQTRLVALRMGEINLKGFNFSAMPFLSQLKELSLPASGLEGLFDLSNFSSLQYLDLSSNRLSEIWGWASLTQLRDLNLADNRLLSLSSLNPMVALDNINVSGNWGFDLASLWGPQLHNLSGLFAARIGLQDIFELPLWQFSRLRELDVSGNQLQHIQGLESLQSLESLDISGNCLAGIVPLVNSEQLIQLNVSNACLVDLAGIIPGGGGSRLERLDIRGNSLHDSLALSNMPSLGSLAVTINDTAQFDDLLLFLQAADQLRELRVENAPIANIDQLPLWSLKSLRVLELSQGQLSSLNGIEVLAGLQELNLSSNQIDQLLPLGTLKKLRTLSLLDNPLQNFTGLQELNSLQELSLDGNNILSDYELNSIVSAQSKLTALHLQNTLLNSLYDLQIQHPLLLSELDLDASQLTSLQGIESFQLLRELKLNHSDLFDVVGLLSLTELRVLHINNNGNQLSGLTYLPLSQLVDLQLNNTGVFDPDYFLTQVGYLEGLQHLGLAGWLLPNIEFIGPEQKQRLLTLNLGNTALTSSQLSDLQGFYSLQRLDISQNNLDAADFLVGMEQLQWLNLADNNLWSIFPLTMLTERMRFLDLSGNLYLPCVELDLFEVNRPLLHFVRPNGCVQGTPPQLTILSPFAGEQYSTSDLITLVANAVDAEDGPLHGQVLWDSSILGLLGSGANLQISLPQGDHLLTASVEDADGNRVQQQISITVVGTQLDYCAASGNSTAYEWIDSIELNGQAVTSGNNGGYLDNSAVQLNLNVGFNQIQLNAGYRYGAYQESWGVWVDLDHNGSFSSAEKIFSASGSYSVLDSFMLPPSSIPGPTRMRVAMTWGGGTQPCGTFGWGEVEDYTVIF